MSWDPSVYLAFGDERTRPAIELAARVRADNPGIVVDLGCGPGNSTAVLAKRWPEARLIGVDSSEKMLTAARASGLRAEWVQADVATWEPPEPVSVIYSNATFHWVPQHKDVFVRLMKSLKPFGALAVQMPRNFDAPSHALLRETAEWGPWRDKLRHVARGKPVDEPHAYYELLAPHAGTIDIWETEYLQALDGENAVYEWVSGTALVPYREALEGELRAQFLTAYRQKLAKAYPRHADLLTLFPFKRIFIVARHAAMRL